jgi:SNF2 family DNA or RNA helicase
MTYEAKTEPRPWQREAIAQSDQRKAYGYFMKPGTGKTKVVIDEVEILNRARLLDRVLVLCPLTVIPVWLSELQKHGHIEDYKVYMFPTDRPKYDGTGRILWMVMSIDSLRGIGYEEAENFLIQSSGKNMMVIDESTTIRNITAQRTQMALKLRSEAGVKYRRILTGTPIANKPLDVYTQLLFLDPDTVKNRTYWQWVARYTIKGGYQGGQILGYRNKDEIAKAIADNSFSVGKAVLGLPPKQYQTRSIVLSQPARKAYNSVVDEVVTYITENKDTITAPIIITKMTKLQQITGGGVKDDDGIVHRVDYGKQAEVLQILDEGAGPTIIWCQFIHEIHQLKSTLEEQRGIKVGVLYGDISVTSRASVVDSFEKGECDVILIQNNTGYTGITLNRAESVIYYSLYWTPEWREQSEDRCHRIGQDKSVMYYDLLAEGTVDHTIYQALITKARLADSIMSRMKDTDSLYNILNGG